MGVCGNAGSWWIVRHAVRPTWPHWSGTIAKATVQATAQVKQLHRQEFACEADALAALEPLAARLPWHELADCRVNPKAHYDRPGKPTADIHPTRITYHADATLSLKIEK